jgi:transcriptional regulator with GAF, ATPase, and Fis domain/multidrug resistance efflux pump
MISSVYDAASELGASLLVAPDAASRAALVASLITQLIPDSACAIHRVVLTEKGSHWTILAVAGDVSHLQESIPEGNSLVAPLLTETPQSVIYPGTEVRREDYAHLNVSRSVESLAYIPLILEEQLVGAIEIFTFAAPLEAEQIDALAPAIGLAAPAILAAETADAQRHELLDSVHRMSQLYDLEKSLNSTLELDQVIEQIPAKAIAMLPCQAIHLWLYDSGALRLVSGCGQDSTVELGVTQAPGEGYVADMAEAGAPLLIDDPDDERLALRNQTFDPDSGVMPVMNALLVPLMQDESEVGVLEAINREDRPFDEDDEFFLMSMAESVSNALKNASLMHAERKLAILEALVHVSSEITSTLRLDRLLQIIANSPQNVLPYELCAIALDSRGRLQLKAISGMTSLPLGDAKVSQVEDILRWLATQPGTVQLSRHDGSEEQVELPEPVTRHFDGSGNRGLFSLPLVDDQGRVGLLLYESSDPDFLDLPHTEMIKILAGQATVAIRNALLYREVPLISILEPLVQRKIALLSTSRSRRLTFAAIAAFVALFLVFCPLPMRVTGEATVAGQHLVTIAAPVDGNVQAVYAHEGQRANAGDLLGTLNDWQWRSDLAAADAKYQEAMLAMQNDLARGAPQAGADRAQTEYLRSEVARIRARIDSAQLRSPITGIVVTPNLENAAGKHLAAGDSFAQVLDLKSAVVEVAVPERDASLLRAGETAAVKLDSYPQRTWRSEVSVVSPQAQAGDGVRTFNAEVPVSNTDAVLRAGMSGRAKVFIGWKPAGYVLLRSPALWLWQTVWDWIGW